MGIAEVGRQAELLIELVVLCELGTVVEGDGEPEGGGQRLKLAQQLTRDGCGRFVRLLGGEEQTGVAFMGDEESLPIAAEQHEVGFPMTGCGTGLNHGRPLMNGDAVLDMVNGTAAA